MKNIVLLGITLKNNNRGCWALTLGALHILCEKYNIKEIVSYDYSGKCEVDEQVIEVNQNKIKLKMFYCKRNDFYFAIIDGLLYRLTGRTNNDIIKILKDAEIVYNISAGDSFTDIYGTKNWLLQFVMSGAAIIMNKPLVFLPQTIGPFKTILGNIMSFIILKNCKKVFIRDKVALKYLKRIGVNPVQEYDVSVYMDPEQIDYEVKPDTIGINISGLMYYKTNLTDTTNIQYYNDLIEHLISELIKKGHNILFIPHTYNAETPTYADDLEAIREITGKINSDKISIVDKNYTAPQLKYIISKCDFFIGSRMHACFAALSTSTPVVGIAYSYKFKGGFEMFNVPECVIEPKDISGNSTSVVEKIVNLINEKEIIKQKLIKINKDRKNIEL